MKRKNANVNTRDCITEIKSKFNDIEKVCKECNGVDYEVTVTSGKDGVHSKNSKHYSGGAIDIRSKDMKLPEYTTLRLKRKLGKDYDIVYEKDHIHIEYDPKPISINKP